MASTLCPALRLGGAALRPALPMLCLASLLLCAGGCPSYQLRPGKTIGGAKHYLKLGRERIFVKDRGSKHRGPALLLIHGYGSAHDAWELIAPKLARRYRVLSLDLPGFGRSDKYEGDYSPAGLARKLRKLLDKKGVRDVHLIAHSWGSSIALALTMQAPARVRSLTLMGAWVFEEQLPAFIRWSRIPGVGEALYALFYDQRLDDRMALAFYDPEPFVHPKVIDAVQRQLRRPGSIRAALQAARQQDFSAQQQRYRTIKTPALLIWGKQDRVSRVHFAHRLDKTLPSSELLLIDHCGHIPAMERPNRVLSRLMPFLARHNGARAARPTSPSSPSSAPKKPTPASKPSARTKAEVQ
jgi:pimeloyl-ACP methyl ester carboxylesterase